MKEIGIGIIGGGYMGKAHAVAYSSVGAVFGTPLRPKLVMVAARSKAQAEIYARKYGFEYSTDNWRELIANPAIDAVIIASPPDTHQEMVEAAAQFRKAVFCEKPLGRNLAESAAMCKAVQEAKIPNMVGFNYIRTPASQYAYSLIQSGVLGQITHFRGEHHEDYQSDPLTEASWRSFGKNNGALGDLSHVINMALRLMGDISEISAMMETQHKTRPYENGFAKVENDDHGQAMIKFENGAMGHLSFSRIATGRKMGYAYEIFGTKGAIRFDQEDQNAIWFYDVNDAPSIRGFRKILIGPEHPDYEAFCLGAGHGTGYQDQIIIEARDFLQAIEGQGAIWPDFREGHEVNRVIAAIRDSSENGQWVKLSAYS